MRYIIIGSWCIVWHRLNYCEQFIYKCVWLSECALDDGTCSLIFPLYKMCRVSCTHSLFNKIVNIYVCALEVCFEHGEWHKVCRKPTSQYALYPRRAHYIFMLEIYLTRSLFSTSFGQAHHMHSSIVPRIDYYPVEHKYTNKQLLCAPQIKICIYALACITTAAARVNQSPLFEGFSHASSRFYSLFLIIIHLCLSFPLPIFSKIWIRWKQATKQHTNNADRCM